MLRPPRRLVHREKWGTPNIAGRARRRLESTTAADWLHETLRNQNRPFVGRDVCASPTLWLTDIQTHKDAECKQTDFVPHTSQTFRLKVRKRRFQFTELLQLRAVKIYDPADQSLDFYIPRAQAMRRILQIACGANLNANIVLRRTLVYELQAKHKAQQILSFTILFKLS